MRLAAAGSFISEANVTFIPYCVHSRDYRLNAAREACDMDITFVNLNSVYFIPRFRLANVTSL